MQQIPMIPNLLQLTIMNILCETMRSCPGSQTPDLGFVLQPLYDAILPRLSWHLHHGILQHDGAAHLHV